MQDENPQLSPEQARHLTVHGVNQNEDGTYSWKFDNYVRAFSPYSFNADEARELWGRITCPTLLVRGTESWASDPIAGRPRRALQERQGRERREGRSLGAPRPAREVPRGGREFLAA